MVRLRIFFLFISILILSLTLTAQEIVKVNANYRYIAPDNISLEVAKQTALERAKIEAIAEKFGTIISQANSTIIKNEDGKSSIDFLSLGNSEVKGEWLETIGEPIFDISYEKGLLIVKVSAKGKIREIVSAPVDFECNILKNGLNKKYSSTDFNEGDDLYLSFKSPIHGYLTVYLLGENKEVYCLLPYKSQNLSTYEIEANKDYLFFSSRFPNPNESAADIDDYTLTCDGKFERNQIYVIFSSNKFNKALDSDSGTMMPRELSLDAFQLWLTNSRKRDINMKVETTLITIKK